MLVDNKIGGATIEPVLKLFFNKQGRFSHHKQKIDKYGG